MTWMPVRSLDLEIMDFDGIPDTDRLKFHRDLAFVHRILGDMQAILRRLRGGGQPVTSVLDIGCGDGSALARIRKEVGAQVTGVDLRPPERDVHGVSILQCDATRDALPPADVAITLLTLHHFTDDQVVQVIRNAARSCHRLICVDLVRHPLPFTMFSLFVGPLIHRVAAEDGRQSIRRAFTAPELKGLVELAIAGTGATYEHEVSRYFAKQIVDIRFG